MVVTNSRNGRRGRVLTKFLDPGELEDHLHIFAWYRSRFHHLGRCHWAKKLRDKFWEISCTNIAQTFSHTILGKTPLHHPEYSWMGIEKIILTESQLCEHLGTNSMYVTEFLPCQAKPKSLTRQPMSPPSENSKMSHDMLLRQAFTKHLPANLLDLPSLPVLFHSGTSTVPPCVLPRG
jgi:hypothetical protein